MEIDFDQAVLSRAGEPMKNDVGEVITLGKLCCLIIDEGLKDSKDTSLKEMMGGLAAVLFKGGVQNIKANQIAQLKEMCGFLPPHLVFKVCELLEGKKED